VRAREGEAREGEAQAGEARGTEAAPLAEPEAQPDEASVATTLPSEAASEVTAPRGRRRGLVAASATALAALTLGAALIDRPFSESLQPSDPANLDAGRVVVAAFSNRTGDSTFDNVSRLAGEEITRGLELTDMVEIADPGRAPPTRAVLAGHEAAAAHASALATGSGLAVWGSVDRRADRIELAAQIVDERSGRVLRALEPVRGDPLDPRPALTILRDHVMAVVAEAVDPRLGASASIAGDPPLYDAYLEFSTGVGIWYDGRNGRDALPHFSRAAALDSTFALPLIWSAWVYQTLGGCDSTAAIARRLTRLHLSRLEKLQIDRQIDRCNGDLPGAYRRAHLLVEARPGSEVWKEQLARDALNFDRPREAVAILAQLHPDRGALRKRVSYYNWLTNAYHLLGEHDRELEVARRARERFPANLAAQRMELVALASLGATRRGEVDTRLAELDALPPDPIRKTATVMREVALDLATHGDSIGARVALARALAWHASRPRGEQRTEYARFERALTHHAAGHADSARAIAAALVRAHPESVDYVGLTGVLAARRGDSVEAARADRVLVGLSRPYARGRGTYWRACIAAEQGRRDEAVSLLKRARAQGHVFNGLFFLNAHLEPSFATLRGYAPFRELLRPVG
jgi:TolB-like protein/tetratricopeptide (TPR) repeat protein